MTFFSHHHYSLSTTSLLLVPLALLALIFIFIYPHEFRIQSYFIEPCSSESSDNKTDTADRPTAPADLRLLFGIVTVPHLHERRHLLRSVYSLQTRRLTTVADVDVRFVVCRSINEEQAMFLSLEIQRYNDIIILNCTENMNNGKTYTYFSSLPGMFGGDGRRPFDYVVKADDDAYFHLENLVKFLMNKPREDLYFGMELSCTGEQAICGENKTFMAGYGYVLSWDLIEWIAESNVARNNKEGAEDVMMGKWINSANKGMNRYNGVPDMYDIKGSLPENSFQREFNPETVAVHKLKENLQWVRTLKYFNLTNELSPSKPYHLAP